MMLAKRGFLLKGPFLQLLLRLYTFLRSPFVYLDVLRDLKRTYFEFRFMRSERSSSDSPVVLIGSMTDFIYQIKQEAFLAFGLRLKGYKPIVLLSRRSVWAPRYFRALGIKEFVYLDQFETDIVERSAAQRACKDFLLQLDSADFKTVKNWHYRDIWIGPQILCAITRKSHLGSIDVRSQEIRKQIESNLPRILEGVDRAKKMIEQLNPKMVLLNESNGPIIGSVTDWSVAKGINVIQFIQPSRDDAVVLKRLNKTTRRFHVNSVSQETMKRLKVLKWSEMDDFTLEKELQSRYEGKWFLQSRNQPNVFTKSKEDIYKALNLDLNKKTSVVFSHILWDANLFYGEDLFEDYADWFENTVRAACSNNNINWIIKLHPANLWKRARDKASGELAEITLIREKIGELPDNVRLLYPDTKISTMSLFSIADYGITVRGTVGIELPCFGVPVLTAGTGRYSGLGFTIDSNTKEEYLAKLHRLQEIPPLSIDAKTLARKHALTVFKYRPWVMTIVKAKFLNNKSGSHPLDHNLYPMENLSSQSGAFPDLEKWGNWAIGEEIDYLNEELMR